MQNFYKDVLTLSFAQEQITAIHPLGTDTPLIAIINQLFAVRGFMHQYKPTCIALCMAVALKAGPESGQVLTLLSIWLLSLPNNNVGEAVDILCTCTRIR